MTDEQKAVLPLYIVGDSHCLAYKNILFPDRWTGAWVSTHAKYISGLTAFDFYNVENGEFHPQFIDFLEYEGLVRDGTATHLSRSEVDFAIAKAAALPATVPLMLFTIGDIDIRAAIMPMLGDRYDFVPPHDTPYATTDKPLVPFDVVREAIVARLKPFVAGLKQLVDCGFNRLYVQAVSPPTLDEKRVEEMHGYRCPASVRTKLVAEFNRELAAQCKAIGVKIVDTWPEVTENGYLKGEFEFDGVHLPPKVAQRHLELVLQDAINCQWFAVNHVRHELYYRMACGLDPFARAADGVAEGVQ